MNGFRHGTEKECVRSKVLYQTEAVVGRVWTRPLSWLAVGHTVNKGDGGSLYIRCRTKSVDSNPTLSPSHLPFLRVRFLMSQEELAWTNQTW
jgi:hypothetical protein